MKFLYEVTLGLLHVVEHVPWPKVAHPLPDIRSISELARLLESVPSLLHRAVITTTYATGMRISEVTRLQVDDVDGDRHLIHVRRGKRGKDRYVMADDALLVCLRWVSSSVVLAVELGVFACGGAEEASTPAVSAVAQPAPVGRSAEGLRGPPGDVVYTCGMGGTFDIAGTCPSGTICEDGICITRPTEGGGHGGGRGGHG